MAAEGLAYCIIPRKDSNPGKDSTIPTTPTVQQIRDDFLDFCQDGIRDAERNPIQDPNGFGAMTGVLRWLAGLERFQANFFIALQPALMFFVSLPNGTNPWAKLPGFMSFVQTGSLTLNLGNGEFISKGGFILDPRKDLEEALAGMKLLIDRVSTKNRPRLFAALRGDPGTDLKQTINEVETEESIDLSGLF